MLPRLLTGSLMAATVLPAAAEIPPFTRVALLGDSITQMSGDATTYYKRGIWTCLSSDLGQQIDLVPNGASPTFATAGFRARDVQSVHLPGVLASNAEACLILAGTNDGDTVEMVAATLKEIGDALADHGITPILCDVLPIAAGIPSRSAWLVHMKSAIKVICDADPRYLHLDWFNVLDADNDGVIDQESYFANDGAKVHPDADGMTRLAAYAANVLAPHLRPRDLFAGITWVSGNPALTAGPGPAPSTWNLYPPAGATVTQSLTPRGNGPGNDWRIAIAGSNPAAITYLASGTVDGPWQPGDIVELIVEYRTESDLSPAWNLRPVLSANPGGVSRIDAETGGTVVTDLLRSPAGILRTPPLMIPPGTTTLDINLQVTGTGTFTLGRTGVRKVPLTFATWINGFPDLADRSPDGDPDGDGLSNRTEWVLGGNPTVSDAGPLTGLAPRAGRADFSFTRTLRSTQDCELFVQHSANLLTWDELPLSEGQSSGLTLTRDPLSPERWTASPSGGASGFFRLRPAWKN
ncbi:MAG: hypothetical protein JWO82_4400 [Akkermansiaceae bacterium]|nr:hypothetical protein [Akkermansiaceae bacterium]